MSHDSKGSSTVVPAQLSFLAIYNPTLGVKEETLREQVVFYSSKASRARKKKRRQPEPGHEEDTDEENEKLRQIGFAQGMVAFAGGFSDGQPVESIETEKSRIVLQELEKNWWILASIDLTRLPSQSQETSQSYEYSSREVAPPILLLRHLVRAHNIFLLHHAPSLDDLYSRLSRSKFEGILDRYWSGFIWNWDVLLHGNPAADVYAGLKLAAGGELGIGVGEEEWGSGEREVLEDFIERTEGLLDIVVSRFGQAEDICYEELEGVRMQGSEIQSQGPRKWNGSGEHPGPDDGVVFSGVGSIDRKSIRTISDWVQTIYTLGEDAYGVHESPKGVHRSRRLRQLNDSESRSKSERLAGRKTSRSRTSKTPPEQPISDDQLAIPPGIPPPIVSAAAASLANATAAAESNGSPFGKMPADAQDVVQTSATSANVMKYLTLGYGSVWGGSSRKGMPPDMGTSNKNAANEEKSDPGPRLPAGRFIIGLMGDRDDDDTEEDIGPDGLVQPEPERAWNSRILIRALHVRQSKTGVLTGKNAAQDGYYFEAVKKVRVVLYLNPPFMFTFLFDLQAVSLAIPSFYRALHHQLGPLQSSLNHSTSPARALQRVAASNNLRPTTTAPGPRHQAIYDLVYEPSNLTVHTSIPNIPAPVGADEGIASRESPWTRIEALNVHSQILNTYASTRRHAAELERTCKTSRGWWVVWMRLPPPAKNEGDETASGDGSLGEALLVRRASDYIAPSSRSASGAQASGGWAPAKLAEGIGIDTRRYIESLLSLNR